MYVNLFEVHAHSDALLRQHFGASSASRRDEKQKILSQSRMSPGHVGFRQDLLGFGIAAVSDDLEKSVPVSIGFVDHGGETHLLVDAGPILSLSILRRRPFEESHRSKEYATCHLPDPAHAEKEKLGFNLLPSPAAITLPVRKKKSLAVICCQFRQPSLCGYRFRW